MLTVENKAFLMPVNKLQRSCTDYKLISSSKSTLLSVEATGHSDQFWHACSVTLAYVLCKRASWAL